MDGVCAGPHAVAACRHLSPAPTLPLFARDRAAAGATRAPPAQRASPRRACSVLNYC